MSLPTPIDDALKEYFAKNRDKGRSKKSDQVLESMDDSLHNIDNTFSDNICTQLMVIGNGIGNTNRSIARIDRNIRAITRSIGNNGGGLINPLAEQLQEEQYALQERTNDTLEAILAELRGGRGGRGGEPPRGGGFLDTITDVLTGGFAAASLVGMARRWIAVNGGKLLSGLMRGLGAAAIVGLEMWRGYSDLGPKIFGKELKDMSFKEKLSSAFGGLAGDLKGGVLNSVLQAAKLGMAGFLVGGPWGLLAGAILGGTLGAFGSEEVAKKIHQTTTEDMVATLLGGALGLYFGGPMGGVIMTTIMTSLLPKLRDKLDELMGTGKKDKGNALPEDLNDAERDRARKLTMRKTPSGEYTGSKYDDPLKQDYIEYYAAEQVRLTRLRKQMLEEGNETAAEVARTELGNLWISLREKGITDVPTPTEAFYDPYIKDRGYVEKLFNRNGSITSDIVTKNISNVVQSSKNLSENDDIDNNNINMDSFLAETLGLAFSAAGLPVKINSIERTSEYQKKMQEMWDRSKTNPNDKEAAEFVKSHGIGFRPADTSAHVSYNGSKINAVDVPSNVANDPTFESVMKSRGYYRPDPIKDPWHYQKIKESGKVAGDLSEASNKAKNTAQTQSPTIIAPTTNNRSGDIINIWSMANDPSKVTIPYRQQ